MGKSCSNSHARKSDKETQSPMLKIFKEIMQRENDPEKANLVREKRRNKKKKLPTPFQSKTEVRKSLDSSGTEGRRHHRFSMNTRKKVFSQHKANTPSYCTKPIHTEKKDSWWFWGEQDNQQGQGHNDDTCSCVSCALKRILANDYACVACLLTIFAISAVAVFCMLFKAIPIASEGKENPECTSKCPPLPMKCGSSFLKQKLEELNSKISHEYGGRKDRSVWDSTLSEFNDNRDSSYFLDHESNAPNDLRTVLDPRRFYNMEPNSAKLKEFYKKLLATDEQIKKLKQGVVDIKQTNRINFNNQDRHKRSLVHSNKAPNVTVSKAKVNITNNGQTVDKPNHKKRRDAPDIRLNDNISELPTGLVYEKKKIIIQYLPETRKFPKCSHTPKDSKSHENDLKHPFYKNTQRLDELLDKFLAKKLPDFSSNHETTNKEPDSMTKFMITDKTTAPIVQVKNKLIPTKSPIKSFYEATEQMYRQYLKPKMAKAKNKLRNDLLKLIKPEPKRNDEYATPRRDYLASHYVPRNYFRDSYRTTSNYDFVLSISTLMNQSGKKQKLASNNMLRRFPSRRLLQSDDKDDETLGYEDLKEVLSDEVNRDVMENEVDRKRRDMRLMMAHQQFVRLTDPSDIPVTAATSLNKNNSPGVHNPNWKGPMPLYPDELNTMIKNAAMQHTDTPNKQALPVIKDTPDLDPNQSDNLNFIKDNVGENDLIESDSFNDVQYIEDYLSNKYDKLVKMAQAYSDYGVLEDKKENLKNEKETDERVKLEAEKPKANSLFSNGFIENAKKRMPSIRKCTSDPDGFKVQIKSKNGLGRNFKLSDHIKISHRDPHEFYSYTTLLPLNSDLDLLNMPTTQGPLTNLKPTRKESQTYSKPFSLGKLKRSLKSVDKDFYFDGVGVDSVTFKPKSDDQAKRNKRSAETLDADKKLELNITVDPEPSVTVLSIAFTNNKTNNDNVTTANVNDSILITNKSIHINETAIATSNMIVDSAASFFFMLTDFFSTLAGFPDNSSYNDPNTRAIKLISQYSDNKNQTTTEKSKEMDYPMYDSDMIDNIGHRSRVLMSVQEENNSSDNGEMIKIIKDSNPTENPESNKKSVSNSTQSLTNITTLITPNDTLKEGSDITKKETNLNKESENKENKTVVKRSIEDSSLIFWNDIYDDEYDIQADPLEKTVREKLSPDFVIGKLPTGNDKVKMSRQWIQDKMKKITDTVKKTSKDGMNKVYAFGSKKRISRDAKDYGIAESGVSKIFKRNNEEGRDEKTAFALMTAHMKQVCKDAAQAVHKTRSLEVHENSKEAAASTGLMAELIKMMSELVDYQVQLKTCVKLPPDLKDFLVWLTASTQPASSYMRQQQQYPLNENYNTDEKEELKPQLVTLPSMTREEDHDSGDKRSECLGTLRAVEDLIREYDQMTEEDKSKMTGIKEYLEAQLDFLNKQLYEAEESVARLYNPPASFRFRRDVSSIRGKPNFRYRGRRHSQKGRIKGALGKYIKSFSKKRTKTTANNYDGQISTEAIKKESVIDTNVKLKEDIDDNALKTIEITTNGGDKEKSGTEVKEAKNINVNEEQIKLKGDGNKDVGKAMKRNLQDVYYRALEEAKKYTTVKKLENDGDNQ